MENQNPRVPILWEHSLTNLLGHDSTSDPGIALRQWVHFQGVHNTGPTRFDRIPSTTPGAEPPRDARDSGSARSHSTHLETSSSNRP